MKRHFIDCYKHLQKCLKSNHQPSRKCTVLTVLTGMAEQTNTRGNPDSKTSHQSNEDIEQINFHSLTGRNEH